MLDSRLCTLTTKTRNRLLYRKSFIHTIKATQIWYRWTATIDGKHIVCRVSTWTRMVRNFVVGIIMVRYV